MGGGSVASTLNVVDPQAIGTAVASKALIVDASKSIVGINSIGVTSLKLGSSTLSASDAVCLSQLSPGSAANGKALVMDSSGSVNGISSLSAASLTGTLQTNLQPKVTQVGTLTSLQVSGAATFSSLADAAGTTSGGALTVSGGMAVAKSVYIGGSLFVSGSTTSVNSSSISIKDNTLVLNASPTGLTDSGILISRFQTSNDSATGSVSADSAFLTTTATGGTTTTVTLASGSSQDNYYQGWWVMVNGTQVRQVVSYVGGLRAATVDSAFTIVPLNGQTVKLYNRSFASFIWNETTKQFQTAFSAQDSSGSLTIIEDAPLYTGAFTTSGIITASNATDATSTLTGSLIARGGVGIAKRLYVGGGVYGTMQTPDQPNITSLGELSTLKITNTSAAGSARLAFTSDVYGGAIGINGASAANPSLLYLEYNNVQRVLIDSLGNVSIGTNTFGYKLNVAGSINASSFSANGSSLATSLISGSITPGVAAVAKVLSTDASLNVSGINSLSLTSLSFGATTITATETNYLTGLVPGTVSASKALVADASKRISGLSSLTLSNGAPTGVVSQTFSSDSQSLVIGVQGSGTSISPNSMYWYFNGGYRLFMNSAGNIAVGISTLDASSFSYKINVNGSVNAASYYLNSIELNFSLTQGVTLGVASPNKVLALNLNKEVTGISRIATDALTLAGYALGATEAGYISAVDVGVAAPNKVLVLDEDLAITGIGLISVDSMLVGGAPVVNSANASFAMLDGVIPGTASAEKALVVDANSDINNIHALGIRDSTALGYAAATFSTNQNVLEIGARGSSNVYGSGLAYINYGGADRLILNTSGNIGIGTASVGVYRLNVNGAFNASSYYINGTQLTMTNLAYFDGVSPGTAAAGKALVANSSVDITGLASVSMTSLTVGNNTVTYEVGFLTGASAGTAENIKALVLGPTGAITGISSVSTASIVVGGSSIGAEAAYVAGATPGTAEANRMIVLDANKFVSGIESIGATSLILGGLTLGATEAGFLAGVSPGTATANKTLVVDSQLDVSGINTLGVASLIVSGVGLGQTEAGYLNGVTAGTVVLRKPS